MPRCSRSLMWCARSRPAATSTRRLTWRICTGPTASAARRPAQSRSRHRSEMRTSRSGRDIPPPKGEGGNPGFEPGEPGGGGRGRWLCVILLFASVAMCATAFGSAIWIASLGPAPLGEGLAFSTLVLDRDGRLLRPYTTPDGRWRLAAKREHVDPRFLDLLFAYEDKRFASHFGIDPLALARAFAQLVTHGHVVSGASTLTMQVARLLEPRGQRS